MRLELLLILLLVQIKEKKMKHLKVLVKRVGRPTEIPLTMSCAKFIELLSASQLKGLDRCEDVIYCSRPIYGCRPSELCVTSKSVIVL